MKNLINCLSLMMILFFVTHAAASQLPQSGQTVLYANGDDGAIRAGITWPNPRFSDNRDGTFNDNLTGLVWSRDANTIKNHNPDFDGDATTGDGAVTWQHALDYIKKLNSEKYLGYTDWRLPNLIELASLVHQGEAVNSLWLSGEGFYSIEQGSYWSSSSSMTIPRMAWSVINNTGPVGFSDKGSMGYVWLVRGGQAAAAVALPQTGQSKCFDALGAHVACKGTGQDGELRMGTAWPAPVSATMAI